METCQRFFIGGLIVTSSLSATFHAHAQGVSGSQSGAADTSVSQPNAPQRLPSPPASGSASSTGLSTADLMAQRSSVTGSGLSSSTTRGDENRYSIMPYTRNGYLGIGLGGSDYDTECGLIGSCENPDFAGKIYTGGMISPFFGMEFGYLHMGRAERGGGHTRAHGLNLSAVGRVPFGGAFAAFGKGGLTYGRTETTADVASGLATGDESGFGPSLGAGLSYDFANNLTAVIEWERHRFKFSTGRDWVDAATVGLKYRF